MKHLIIATLVAIASLSAMAQQKKPYPVYCNVMGYNFWGAGKVKVQLDMGRFTKGKGYESIYQPDGKKMKFHTMMAVLNYMSERGWKCVGTYFISEPTGGKVVHYLLEKYINDPEEMKEGLILREESEKLDEEEKAEYEKNRVDDLY